MDFKRITIVVHGLVQGVGYRNFAFQHARKLGLKGFVRNMPDGTVVCQIEGEESPILSYLEFLRKGPAFAEVSRIETFWDTYKNEFSSFEIRF